MRRSGACRDLIDQVSGERQAQRVARRPEKAGEVITRHSS
jgi:hypothetical protein